MKPNGRTNMTKGMIDSSGTLGDVIRLGNLTHATDSDQNFTGSWQEAGWMSNNFTRTIS